MFRDEKLQVTLWELTYPMQCAAVIIHLEFMMDPLHMCEFERRSDT